MVSKTQAENAIEKNEEAANKKGKSTQANLGVAEVAPMTGPGTGFESKEDKVDKDAGIVRTEPQANVNVVDAKNASEPVKIMQSHGVEVQREENGILSTKRTDDTITLGNKISAVDATKGAKMDLMQCTLQEIAENLHKWETKARQANDYAAESKFATIANALGGVVNHVRNLSIADLNYTAE
jgi:hypothetical protein